MESTDTLAVIGNGGVVEAFSLKESSMRTMVLRRLSCGEGRWTNMASEGGSLDLLSLVLVGVVGTILFVGD